MKKYHILAGGVAVCALAVVLTTTTTLTGGVNLPGKDHVSRGNFSTGGNIESSPLEMLFGGDTRVELSTTDSSNHEQHELQPALQSEEAVRRAGTAPTVVAAPPPPPPSVVVPVSPPPPALSAAPAGQQMGLFYGARPEKSIANEMVAEQRAKMPATAAESIVMAPQPDMTMPVYKEEGRDKFEDIKANPVKLVAEEPVSTLSVDVDTTSYSFMRRELNHGNLPQKDAIRVEELINYFDYDYALPESKAEPFKPTIAVYPTPWNKNTKLLHIGIKGYDIAPAQKPVSNLVFLLDVSGSMNEPDKLPLLKNAFKLLVDSLSPSDTVSIVVYAGSAGTVLEPTKASEKHKIIAALDNLTAGGSTAGGEGIRRAYELAEANFNKEGVNRVILATDGDFNVGITDPEELKGFVERKRQTGVFLSVLGFGQGNYNDALMQKLAQNGNGNAAYIDTLNEARKVLVEEASSTLFPIAKDVKFQVEFNPNLISEYRLIGYETRLLNREDFNNDKVDAGDMGAGHTVTAIYEITPKGSESGMIDPLRYGKKEVHKPVEESPQFGGEYAFLKMRYKLPNEDKSKLIERPITKADEVESVDRAPVDVRFAASVAAYGQILRGDPFTQNFTYEDVLKLAETSKGEDKFGYRAEFINLVRLAKSMR